MNKSSILFGLDCWLVNIPITTLLRLAKINRIELYEVKQRKKGIEFYTPVFLRFQVTHTYHRAELLYTTGAIGFILKQIKEPIKMVCTFLSIGIWYFYAQCVFAIEVDGSKNELKNKIFTAIEELGYKPPFIISDQFSTREFEYQIKEALEDEIAWIEIVKQGSRFQVYFTAKEYVETVPLNNHPLYATKDAMVVHFDVQHGNKKVAVNQIVNKGDLLVDNLLKDAFEQDKEVYVKGRVFGHTWYTIETELNMDEPHELEKPFIFLRMLMECRSQIATEIFKDEKIIKENILHFRYETGKIRMKVHYTLLEDITRP